MPNKDDSCDRISGLSLAAGIALLPMLPLGMWAGTGHALFYACFLLHVILLSAALFTTLNFFVRSCRETRAFGLVAGAATLISTAFIALEGLHPITARDALIHHLAVPKWWVEQGVIAPIFWHDWSFYPMLLNLAFTALLGAGLEQATPYYHAVYLFLLAGAAGAFVRGRATPSAGLAAAAFVMLTPVCVKLAGEPLVDLGLALFGAIAAFEAILWAETPSVRRALKIGAAMGLAAGTKYNGFLFIGVLAAAILWIAARRRIGPRAFITGAAAAGIAAALLFAPWAWKNADWTGNPIYPLMRGTFGPPSDAPAARVLSPLEQRIRLYGESWAETALLPLRMLVSGEDGNPRRFDGVLTPLFLVALVPLIFKGRRDDRIFLALVSGLYWALALLTAGARVRYLAPIFGPLAALSAFGAADLHDRVPARLRRFVFPVLIGAAVLFAAPKLWRTVNNSGAVGWFARKDMTRSKFLAEQIPEYSSISRLNSLALPDQKVYTILTGNQFYYYRPRVFSGGHFSAAPLVRWIKEADSAEALARRVASFDINYLLMNEPRLERLFAEALSDGERARWSELLSRHARLLAETPAASLWELAPAQPEPGE